MTWARARRGVVLALAIVLAIASAVPVSRIRFETDVLQLMPRDSGAVDAFETYLERFRAVDGQRPASTIAPFKDDGIDAIFKR